MATVEIEEVRFVPADKWGNPKSGVNILNMEYPLWKARMATCLLEKWGMVSAQDDGEDSVGRQKLHTLTPAECVDRACTMADLAVDEFRKRGWTATIPESIGNATGDND